MIKFCIASHGRLAAGMLDSLKMFLGEDIPFETITAYVDESNPELSIQGIVEKTPDEDILIFLTDIAGGSVNQIVVRTALQRPNTHIISGFNFPLILELATIQDNVTSEIIRNIIENSKQQIMYVNDAFANLNEDDE